MGRVGPLGRAAAAGARLAVQGLAQALRLRLGDSTQILLTLELLLRPLGKIPLAANLPLGTSSTRRHFV